MAFIIFDIIFIISLIIVAYTTCFMPIKDITEKYNIPKQAQSDISFYITAIFLYSIVIAHVSLDLVSKII